MNHVDPAGTGTVILGCSCNCLHLPPQEKMLGYECSHMYDPQMMESVLGDLYLHFHRILDPLTQGQPVTRKRLWGIMLKKSSLAEWSFGMSLKGGWPHSRMDMMLSRLLSLFNRKCEVPFHAFLLATEDEIMWDCEWMRSRPTSSAKNRPQTTAEIFAHEGTTHKNGKEDVFDRFIQGI